MVLTVGRLPNGYASVVSDAVAFVLVTTGMDAMFVPLTDVSCVLTSQTLPFLLESPEEQIFDLIKNSIKIWASEKSKPI
jgi:hypothetical protein